MRGWVRHRGATIFEAIRRSAARVVSGKHYRHDSAPGFFRHPVILAVAYLATGTTLTTTASATNPTGLGKVQWLVTWSSTSVAGEADNKAAAISAVNAVNTAAGDLRFDGADIGSNNRLTTEKYAPDPLYSDPLETVPYDYWGFSGCFPIYQIVCNANHYPSLQEWKQAVASAVAATSNTCAVSSWVENTPWFFGTYNPVNLADPRTREARASLTLPWTYKGKPPGQPWEEATCAYPQPESMTIVVAARRTLDCPTPSSSFNLQMAEGTPQDPSPYYHCRNQTSAELTYYTVAEQAGQCNEVGNPCDAATGEKTQTIVDYDGPMLMFERTYRSNMYYANKKYGPLGYGWRHSFERTIVADSSGVPQAIIRTNGSLETLASVGAGEYVSRTGSGLRLKKIIQTAPGGPYNVGFNFTAYLPTGEREIYQCYGSTSGTDCSGAAVSWQLTAIVAAAGQTTALTYSAPDNNPIMITDQFGHQLSMTYAAPVNCESNIDEDCVPRLDYVTEPGGTRQINFIYDDSSATAWGQQLTEVVYPDDTSEKYQYTMLLDPAAVGRYASVLSGIEDGNHTTFALFDYWPDRRAKSTEHTGGFQKFTLAYNANETTTVNDAASNATVYSFSSFTGGLRQPTVLTYADGSTLERFYESSGQRRLTDQYATKPVPGGGSMTINHQHFDFDPYHRIARHEAFATSFARVTNYEYLNPTANLLRFVKSPSVESGKRKWLETTYWPATQLPHELIETTRLSDGSIDTSAPTRMTSIAWSGYGHVTAIDGPRTDVSDITTVEFWDEVGGVPCTTGGKCGQIRSITNAASQTTWFDEYYADGRLKQLRDPNGLITAFTYDARGRVDTVTETPPSGTPRVTNYDYDQAGQLDKVTLPNGQYLDYTWTEAHLLDYVTDNAGNKIDYSYDLRGNRTGEDLKDPSGSLKKALAMVYDVHNRLDTLTEGSRPSADLNFDATGLLEDETDSGGHPTDYEYDPLNRLQKIIDAQNGSAAPTLYGYNARDDLISVEAPNDAATTYVYDDLGNLRKEVSPDRGTTLYGYDAAGNITCKADGRTSGSATTCETAASHWSYQYDALNRLTSVDYPASAANPDVSFQWDTRSGAPAQYGRLRQVSYTQGTVTVTRRMDYDAWGNVTWSQQAIVDGSTTRTLTSTFSYDGNNQLTQITYPSGRVVDYIRYSNGRIQMIKATFNGVTTTLVSGVSYAPFGPPTQVVFGNALTAWTPYDQTYAPAESQLVLATPPYAFDARTYELNNTGNITGIDDWITPANSRDYDYDALSRLTRDSGVSGSFQTYTYDANGNRLERRGTNGTVYETLSYSPGSNRVATSALGSPPGTPVPAQYDGMGNLTYRPGWSSDAALLSYDAAGRLNYLKDIGINTDLDLDYNGLGELARTRKYAADSCGGVTVLAMEYFSFTPDGRALELVSENQVQVTADWIWLDEQPVAQLQDSHDAQGVYQGTAITYLHSDHLGTPRLGTDEAQQLTWRWQSDAFGGGAPTGTAVVRLRLPGQVSLGVANTNYNYYREYFPGWGRYVESDPIGLKAGVNTYAYVGSNPVSRRDPFGLMCTAGLGCYTTPAEAAAAQAGNYLGYYQLACAGGDAYACYAEHIAADDNISGHVATWWLKRNLKKVADANKQCINEEGILNQIRQGLANDYAKYLPTSPADARWPSALDISQIHWDEFGKYGLPPSAFGGTPLGSGAGPILPGVWCPNCRP